MTFQPTLSVYMTLKGLSFLLCACVWCFAHVAGQYEVETIEAKKLKLLAKIGDGGFGEVHHAIHSDWGPVAYKRLTVQFIRPHDR